MVLNLKKLKSNQRGSSLVEFALIFPIFITIILSTLEMGIMLAIKVNLNGCVQAAAYYGEAGSYASGASRTASAQTIMMQGVSGLLDLSKLVATIQSYPSFSAANSGGTGSAGTGDAGDIGMYQMRYTYSPTSPLVASIFGITYTLQATTYVKNEEIFPQ